jgi:hypothetical protein
MEKMNSTSLNFGLNSCSVLWAVVLLLRSLGLTLTGVAFILSFVLLALALIRSCIFSIKTNQTPLLYFGISIAFLLSFPKFNISFEGSVSAGIAACIASLTFLYFSFHQPIAVVKPWVVLLTLTIVSCGILPPGQFHRIYRNEPFEVYVTDRFPAASPEAQTLIENNVPEEGKKSGTMNHYRQALEFFQSRQAEESLNEINIYLDFNPHQAEGHLLRGKIRLLLMELDQHTAQLAIKDFTRAIHYNPKLAEPYFRRAMAKLYLDHHAVVCDDLLHSFTLDTSLQKYIWDMADSACRIELNRSLPELNP